MIVSDKLRKSAGQRFLSKYRVCQISGCWLWTASVNQKRGGYGRFSFGCRTIGAHKASWILMRRPLASMSATLSALRGSEEWLFYAIRGMARTLRWWYDHDFLSIKGTK